MQIRNWIAISVLTASTAFMAAPVATLAQPATHINKTEKPVLKAGPLKITYGDKSAEWTPATLATLPHQSVTVINSHNKKSLTFSGVPLTDLLTQLGVPNKSEGPLLKIYLVTVGADGYKVVYSLAEVTPAVSHSSVIVADALDGKPLTSAVPLQLVNTADKGLSRCVRNLVAVQVLTVE